MASVPLRRPVREGGGVSHVDDCVVEHFDTCFYKWVAEKSRRIFSTFRVMGGLFVAKMAGVFRGRDT